MANHLEHGTAFSHVSFNLMVAEICTALEQGLEAGNAGDRPSLDRCKLTGLRQQDAAGLTDADLFRRRRVLMARRETGRRRQRRTFNLKPHQRSRGPGAGLHASAPAPTELPRRNPPRPPSRNPSRPRSRTRRVNRSRNPWRQPERSTGTTPQSLRRRPSNRPWQWSHHPHRRKDDEDYDEPQPRNVRRPSLHQPPAQELTTKTNPTATILYV